ncbi:hypothetical protein [Deinococcus sp.]|uniref:hypothetical protein n=1 Tax=Deinococcus sp. TaxID=47478 RepID=UPI003B5BDB70
MKAAPALNEARAHTWAAVALGMVKKASADRALPLNTVEKFERFYWAAWGKVKPSVRWKKGRKAKRTAVYKAFSIFTFRQLKGLSNRYMDGILRSGGVYRAFKNQNPCPLNLEVYDYLELTDYPATYVYNYGNELIKYITNGVKSVLENGIEGAENRIYKPSLYRLLKWAACNRKMWQSVAREALEQRITLTALLKHLEAEAYRAHLAKRVKPVSRRIRVRRPLYARPRPPTCPLAPPVI